MKTLTRREWTANPADPTVVTQWNWHPKRIGSPRPSGGRRIELVMTASWGVDAKLTLFGRTWRTYDNRFFVWLFGLLEDRYQREQMAYDDDPMEYYR